MRKQRIFNTNGQEVTIGDLNQMASNDGAVMDFAVSEFFRLQVLNAGSVGKAVIPFGMFKTNGVDPQGAGIVTTNGTTDRLIRIYPFRAAVSVIDVSAAPTSGWENTRTVDVTVPDANAGFLYSLLQLGTTDGTHSRCDLVWVKVSIGTATSEIRFKRDPGTGVVSAPSTAIEVNDTYTLGVTPGALTTGTTPARPALPADTATDFYIPLAYVFIPPSFSATAVNDIWIQEVAPVIPLSRTTGAATCRIATWQNTAASPILSVDDFNTGTGGHRALGYLPTTMVGNEQLILAASWDTSAGFQMPALTVSATTYVVDNSVDWRKRLFKWTATTKHDNSVVDFAWANGNCPSAQAGDFAFGMGQSFFNDCGFLSITGGLVAQIATTSMPNTVYLFVDLSTGALKMRVPGSANSPNARLIVWLEASGQFANVS